MKSIIKAWLRRAEVDWAVFYGVLASGWQLAFAPITVVLIARYLSPEVQGFYYTFMSLIALQSFLELGLSVVVLNVASHEWAHLALDKKRCVSGDPRALSRLVSLGKFVGKWYAVGSMLFMIGVGIVGHIFLSQQTYQYITWVGPWWSLVFLSGLLLWCMPFNSLLEGCNQVVTLQKFRLSQLIVKNVALWLTLVFNWQLWAAVAAMGVSFLCNMYLFGIEYRSFFKSFFYQPIRYKIDWKTEIFPMQWRLALSGVASYFMFQMFTPVMFYYHGAVVAGQMGMTMAVVAALQGVSLKWLQPKAPVFGMLISRKNFIDLNRLWRRTARAVFFVALFGASCAWSIIYGLNLLNIPISGRLLPPLPTALFFAATIFMAVGYCETVYLRAHKKEPIMVLSIVTSLLMGLMVWLLGRRFGPLGAAAAYLIVIGGISLPWETVIFFRRRIEWHTI